MKVKELIEQLQAEDPEMDVHIETPSHDYWHTKLAYSVREVAVTAIVRSDYHRTWKVAGDADDGTAHNVVLLA